ncbi:serine hydrolase domain-containing protein [Nonomuraea sp. NPDC050310]|uniref:serine hydrolase domain-containing protein n=1 Tax=Nonomuraea sp. NPDC050310 TaxID=3154935 RepID=UPI0033F67633
MITRRTLLTAGAATLALGALPARAALASTPVTGDLPSELAPLDALLRAFIAERDISCAQLAVAKAGRLVLARGYGSYGPAETPVQPTSLFRVASLSKQLTAAAIMRLVQEGRLRLSDSVADLLGLSLAADPRLVTVSVRRLLQHLGGWDKAAAGRDYLFSDRAIAEEFGVPLPIGMEHILRYATARPLDHDPGARYSYNNYNYLLLGRIIEKVSGQDYETYVKTKVMAPLGVSRPRLTTNAGTGEVPYLSKYRVTTVLDDSGTVVPYPYGGTNYANSDSAGGWTTSAVDLVRLTRIFDGATPVLTPASVATLLARPVGGPFGSDFWYGGGWGVTPVGGGLKLMHSGSLPGAFAVLSRSHNGIALCATFNRREESGSPDFDAFHGELFDAAQAIKTWPAGDLSPQYF